MQSKTTSQETPQPSLDSARPADIYHREPSPALSTENGADAPGGGLPFDVVTILLGFWRRKWLMLFGAAMSVGLAVFGAMQLGKQTWKAETILLWSGTEGELEGGFYKTPSLATQLNMIKLLSNLAQVREDLTLSVDLKAIGGAVEAEVQRDTALMFIRSEWGDPVVAASLANGVRDTFMESLVDLRRREANEYAEFLRSRRNDVSKDLARADHALGEFTTANSIVDLSQESQWLLEEFSNLDVLHEQAKIDQEMTDLKLSNLEKIIAELKSEIAQEQGQDRAALESVTVANIRAERVRERIQESKTEEINHALLVERELDYKRAQRMFDQNLIPESELDAARARWETQKVRTEDSEEVENLKHELAELDKVIVPDSSGGGAQSAPILQEVLIRSLDLKLEKASLSKRVEILNAKLGDLRTKLDRLPNIQKEFVVLQRDVTAREAEQRDVNTRLVDAERLASMATPYFSVISDAQPPLFPSSSNKKVIAIALAFLGMLVTFAWVVGSTLMDTSVKSQTDARLKLKLPTLGEAPRQKSKAAIIPIGEPPRMLEELKILAHSVRRKNPTRGLRLFVTSAEASEGRSTICAALSYCLGMTDERILVIDGAVRGGHQNPFHDLVNKDAPAEERALQANSGVKPERRRFWQRKPKAEPVSSNSLPYERGQTGLKGLCEYLCFDCEEYREAVHPTHMPGVEFMPCDGRVLPPDLLASHRMAEMLDQVSKDFTLVLIDGPPVLPYVDSEMLAEHCDAILLVVRADKTRPTAMKRAMARLKECDRPILGVVVNSVDPLFAGRT